MVSRLGVSIPRVNTILLNKSSISISFESQMEVTGVRC